MNKLTSFFIWFFCLLLVLFGVAHAEEASREKTPFDSYIRVSDKFFVYNQSLISPYTGPDVSHWELLLPHGLDDNEHDMDRKRLGIVSLTPTLQVYLDVLWDPMTEYYEFRDIKVGKLIHRFSYYGGLNGALLVNGQGAVYQYTTPGNMCFGRETKKFILKNEKLVEVQQPFAYWESSETTTLENVTLYFSPSETSSQVALLTKGTVVKVLTSNKDSWYLIKTPLGLTGWVAPFIKGNKATNDSNFTEWLETLDIPICN